MRKILTGLAVGALIVVAGVASPKAHAAASHTNITGTVQHDGQPMADAEVSITCENATQTDTTDATGAYLVRFDDTECPLGSTAKIAATKGSLSGSGTGEVVAVTTKLNTSVVNVSLPEYGLLGGIVAAGAGVGAIVFMRRRFGQSEASF